MKIIKTLITFLCYSCMIGGVEALSQEGIRSLAERALQTDWDGWRDPKAERPFVLVELGSQLQGSVMAYRVNRNDPRVGADTITIVYQVPALAWAAFGFSDNGGSMIGSEAVIALPETGEVLKYNLGGKSLAGVQPSPSQTLVESGMVQENGATTLAFTKIMQESGEVPILANGLNTFLGAWGSSNTLGIHSFRQPFNIDLDTGAGQMITPGEGVVATQPTQTDSPVTGEENDVGADGFTTIELDGQLAGSNLRFQINQNDANAEGQDTITIVYTIPAAAWAAVAFSDNGGFMIGSEAVIGLPDTEEVLKYNLNAKNNAGVVPMGDQQQTLIDASITQDGTTTVLTFTKILVEDGEIPINLGESIILGAWGSSNNLGTHAVRESFALDLVGGFVGGAVNVRKQSLWKAHGFIAGIAWGLLSPLAISASVLRKFFKGGLWFQIHRGLNILVVLATIIAFAIAVVAINQETPEGASANHFNPDPNPHKLIGLVIFIIAIVQALLGIFRPHVPDEGKAKSSVRIAWEILHRCLGFFCLFLAIYQVQSGIKIYLNIFASDADYLLTVFWTVIAIIFGVTLVGYVSSHFFDTCSDDVPSTKPATVVADADYYMNDKELPSY